MAVLTTDCSHCHAQKMTFDVIGAHVSGATFRNVPFASVGAVCRSCGYPIAILMVSKFTTESADTLRQRVSQALNLQMDLEGSALKPAMVWPEVKGPSIPDNLPPDVERAFLQGERNLAQPGCEEAAAMMYRRSLEVGLKIAYPDMTGMLAVRIKKLVADHHLPAPIGDWLDQVKLIGNEGAHEIDGVVRDDLEAQRDFVDMALRYIFTMPAQIAARRGLPTEVA